MRYRQATANRREFFRTPALSARTIKAPAAVPGALSCCSQLCRSTGTRTVEGRARIAAALLIASVVPRWYFQRAMHSARNTP